MKMVHRPKIGRAAVKEGFDNLPSGICFADRNGTVILCNRQMHRLCYALLGMDLPDKVVFTIAEKVTANVRQLEGTINKILAYKDLLGSDADEETVERAMQDILKRSNEYIPTPEAILECISKYYGLEEAIIRGQQRVRDAVAARQIAMYLIRSMTNLSLDDIGKVFDNRDHSTVLYSIKQVEKQMKKDPSFAERVKEIKTNINSKR